MAAAWLERSRRILSEMAATPFRRGSTRYILSSCGGICVGLLIASTFVFVPPGLTAIGHPYLALAPNGYLPATPSERIATLRMVKDLSTDPDFDHPDVVQSRLNLWPHTESFNTGNTFAITKITPQLLRQFSRVDISNGAVVIISEFCITLDEIRHVFGDDLAEITLYASRPTPPKSLMSVQTGKNRVLFHMTHSLDGSKCYGELSIRQ
ncbi:MAG: hypothetical protein NVSMB18_19490 [Acetobacteraceae bacterium]